jgi:5' nucleotidase, deoxy (Pyrimidine), cytosolic type C protein (NT5C)
MTLQQPVVAVDIDGVCCDYIAVISAAVGKERYAGKSYRLDDWFNNDHFRAVHTRAFEEGLFANAPVIEGSQIGVSQLATAGIRPVAVSNRFSCKEEPVGWVDQVESWIVSRGFKFYDLAIGNSKLDAIFAAHVDDSISVIEKVRGIGRLGIIFDQPWNGGLASPRLYGWQGASRLIASLLEIEPDSGALRRVKM